LRPLSNAVAMINMDMIGRLRDNKLYIGGVATGSTFKTVVEHATEHAGFQADQSDIGGYGASDHTSFTVKQVPTLFFFSGLHSDYHKPSDTWDKIDPKDAVRVLAEVSEIATALADAADRPQFVRVAENPHSANAAASGVGGYGPYFGSIPDFGGPPHGVRFSDVHEGSPAAKAGLRAGDVLVEFDGKPIDNLYDFTYALRQHKPGDKVKVKVLRSGAPLVADVILTKRN
jgi:PDZ domain-containing protein/peptidase M28-like protein